MNRDSVQVHISDTHCGGLTALFPDYPMTFKYDEKNILSYTPTEDQKEMYRHLIKCADEVKRIGIGKRIQVTVNGDVIEGAHHNTIQIISPKPNHHTEIFIEVFDAFLDRIGYSVNNGDELHFISGTESHTGWEEYGISRHYEVFGAQYHDELKKEINGREIWWTHQGARPGKGVNEGNAHRNWMRDIYYDCIKQNKKPPHLIVNSHYHKAHHGIYNDSYNHTIHGIILPSWQKKTRFGQRAAPFERNDIGLNITEVTAEGDLRIHKPLLMENNE